MEKLTFDWNLKDIYKPKKKQEQILKNLKKNILLL